MIVRAKIYVYDYVESQRLLYCRQTYKSYENEQRLFCDKSTYSLRTGDLSSRKGAHQKRLVIHIDNYSVHTNRVSTDWLEEHSILRMPHLPYSPDLASSDFYLFPTVKEKFERTYLANGDQFFECLQEILSDLNQQELNPYFTLRCAGFKKQVKAMEATSDDKQMIYI
jgi:hypothetical protein